VLSNIKNIFKVQDLRNKILFTFMIVALYRVGTAIRVPGVDPLAIAQIEEGAQRSHESLVREAKSLEERRQRVLDGLRDLAAQLQDALVEPTNRETDHSLADALDVERRR